MLWNAAINQQWTLKVAQHQVFTWTIKCHEPQNQGANQLHCSEVHHRTKCWFPHNLGIWFGLVWFGLISVPRFLLQKFAHCTLFEPRFFDQLRRWVINSYCWSWDPWLVDNPIGTIIIVKIIGNHERINYFSWKLPISEVAWFQTFHLQPWNYNCIVGNL